MKKIVLTLLSLVVAATMFAQVTTDTGKSTGTTDMSLRSVYTTSYSLAERSLPNIAKVNFNNDWNSVDLNSPPIQEEISKFVSSQTSRMPGVDQIQIRQQTEAAFSAALFQLKHNSNATGGK